MRAGEGDVLLNSVGFFFDCDDGLTVVLFRDGESSLTLSNRDVCDIRLIDKQIEVSADVFDKHGCLLRCAGCAWATLERVSPSSKVG